MNYNKEKIKLFLDKHEVLYSEQEIETLSKGYPVKFVNAKISDEIKTDANVRFYNNESGSLEAAWQLHVNKLNIPKKMFGNKLTEEQQKDLSLGKEILLKVGRKDIKIAIDTKSNTLQVSAPGKQINHRKLGITEEQLNKLLTGKTLNTQIYYDQKTNTHFKANLAYDPKTEKLTFTNLLKVSSSKVATQQEQLDQTKPLETKDLQDQNKFNDLIDKCVKNKNFDELYTLTSKGDSFSKEQLTALKANSSFLNLPEKQKIAIMVSLRVVEPNKVLDQLTGRDKDKEQAILRGKEMNKSIGLPKSKSNQI